MCNWEARRVAFNHDWLKTEYLKSVNAFISRIENDEAAQSSLEIFRDEEFPQWDTQRHTAQSLLESFETEMSPRTLFDAPPLSRCPADIKSAWGETVHELWLYRYAIPTRTQTGRDAVLAVDTEYATLSARLSQHTSTEGLRGLLPLLRKYSAACTQLSEAMGIFLPEVRVV